MLGNGIKESKLPKRPGSFESLMEALGATGTYYKALRKEVREKWLPPLNHIKLLATGNRDDESAIDEVEGWAEDSATLGKLDKAREFVSALKVMGMGRDEFDVIYDSLMHEELVSNFNAEAMASQMRAGRESLQRVGPYAKIAPNGTAYSMTDQPWILDMDQENIVQYVKTNGTPTGNKGVATTPGWGATARALEVYLKDVDTTGYNTFPAKPSLYDWKAVMTVRAKFFNDNGTGTQGDVAAADLPWSAWFRAWTAETIGGTSTGSSEVEVRVNDALTAAGDELVDVSAELSCPVSPLSTDATQSEYIHIDWAVGAVTTSGVAGLGFGGSGDFHVSNVRLIGYPKERAASYADITYRDVDGVHAIKKDDEFIDHFGKLVIQSNDDPNYSVDAIYRDRVGASGHILGGMIETLKSYSALKHKGTDTLDQKYINLNVPGGISDLVGVRHYLDRTKPPFGDSLTTAVTDKDDMTFLFATLNEDLIILEEGMKHDKDLAKQSVKIMPFSTSSNVHV
jgi:hypothetical protein